MHVLFTCARKGAGTIDAAGLFSISRVDPAVTIVATSEVDPTIVSYRLTP